MACEFDLICNKCTEHCHFTEETALCTYKNRIKAAIRKVMEG